MKIILTLKEMEKITKENNHEKLNYFFISINLSNKYNMQ